MLLCFAGETTYTGPKSGDSYLFDLTNGTETAVDWMYSSWDYGMEPPEGVFKVSCGDLYGVVNTAAEMVVPCRMKSIRLLKDGYMLVYESGAGYGVYDASGSQIIPCEYAHISYDSGKFTLISRSFSDGFETYLSIVDGEGNVIY